MSDALFASVLLDNAIDQPLDYAVPETMQGKLTSGMRVLVPVRGSLRKGTILSFNSTSLYTGVKPIQEILSEKEVVSKELIKLAQWISTYYAAPLRKALKLLLPPPVLQGKSEKKQLLVKSRYSQNQLKELCAGLREKQPRQAAVLDLLLKAPQGIFLSKLLEESKLSRSPVETLVKNQIVTCLPVPVDRSPIFDAPFFPTKHKTLNPEQEEALNQIKKSLTSHLFATHLLYGVTGSGKTEIYLQAMEEALLLNKSVLFLVPEIALTSQTIERIRGRFKERIVLLHHRLSAGERLDSWNHIAHARAPIVVGARSALFSPLSNLGLIIVDEEHESSYKQTDEAPCYHARDLSIVRAKFSNATVILGSATPSLESFYNAAQGKYQLNTLTTRPNSAQLPKITLIDMRKEFEKAKGFTLFSDKLLTEIEARFKKGEQTLLFLNRRGYHTARQCLKCGDLMRCPHCELSLTFHQKSNRLACHLCDYHLPPPRNCPKCQESEGWKYKGAGTELVEKSLYALFPELRILRLDADTTKEKGAHEKLYKEFRSGKADLLIGTQMIAKGLHFPMVTLVGILNIDSTLHIPDFRASEMAFQLITQVAGRSGRGSMKGEVLIQTHLPEHPTILQAASHDFNSFYQSEIAIREGFDYPPFIRLAKFIFTGKNPQETEKSACRLREFLISHLPEHFQFLPVVACGHAKIKDNYRFQFLIKSQKMTPLLHLLPKVQERCPPPKGIRQQIDIDPLSTFF